MGSVLRSNRRLIGDCPETPRLSLQINEGEVNVIVDLMNSDDIKQHFERDPIIEKSFDWLRCILHHILPAEIQNNDQNLYHAY